MNIGRLAKDAANKALESLPLQAGNGIYRWRQVHNVRPWLDASFFFVHIPKCGGISLAEAFSLSDPGHFLKEDLPHRYQLALSHKPAIVVLRDPVARSLSMFQYVHGLLNKRTPSYLANLAIEVEFERWCLRFLTERNVRNHYFLRPMVDFIASAKRMGMVIHAVELKNMEAGAQVFAGLHDLKIKQMQRRNVSKKIDHLDLEITDRARQIIQYAYSEDQKLMNFLHGFDSPLAVLDGFSGV